MPREPLAKKRRNDTGRRMAALRIRLAELLGFLRSTPPAANLFALSTLALWILKALFLDFVPGFFPGAYELGKVVEGVLSAIIAGWVFYLFFALLPEARRRSHIAPFVLQSVSMIVSDANSVLQEVAKATGRLLSFSQVSERKLTSAFANASFRSRTTMLMDLSGRDATWLEFFEILRQRTKERIAEVKEQSQYVEPELSAIILRINQNNFFMMAERMERFAVENNDLSGFAAAFHKYLSECRELAKWHDANLVASKSPIHPSLD